MSSLSSTSPLASFKNASKRSSKSEGLMDNNWVRNSLYVVVVVIIITYINSYIQTPSVTPEDLNSCGNINVIQPPVISTKKQSFTKVLWFYAPWCGHCVAFNPQWNRFLPMKPNTLEAVQLNGDESVNRPLMDKYNIRGFPTFIFVRSDDTWETYNGSRTAEGLLDFLSK